MSEKSQDFRPDDILGVSQGIKGFDTSDFCEVFSMNYRFRKIQVGIKKNMAIKPILSPLCPKAGFFL